MLLAVMDFMNDCSFGIEFDAVEKLDLVKELALEGLGAWYQAAHEDKTNKYFTEEEIEGFYESGYAEPTSELLDRYKIEHEIVHLEFDDDGECITECDEIIEY